MRIIPYNFALDKNRSQPKKGYADFSEIKDDYVLTNPIGPIIEEILQDRSH
jgi:hypothetical protein